MNAVSMNIVVTDDMIPPFLRRVSGLSPSMKILLALEYLDSISQPSLRRIKREADKDEQKSKAMESIHPRCSGGHTIHKKVNTAKKPSRHVIERKIANITAHMERTGDRTPSSYLGKLMARLECLPAGA